MKLYIFRHGQTDGNVRNIVQGAGVDIELNETGRRQAERLAAELKGEGLDVIYASPMKRADETARIVAAAAGVPVLEGQDVPRQGKKGGNTPCLNSSMCARPLTPAPSTQRPH